MHLYDLYQFYCNNKSNKNLIQISFNVTYLHFKIYHSAGKKNCSQLISWFKIQICSSCSVSNIWVHYKANIFTRSYSITQNVKPTHAYTWMFIQRRMPCSTTLLFNNRSQEPFLSPYSAHSLKRRRVHVLAMASIPLLFVCLAQVWTTESSHTQSFIVFLYRDPFLHDCESCFFNGSWPHRQNGLSMQGLLLMAVLVSPGHMEKWGRGLLLPFWFPCIHWQCVKKADSCTNRIKVLVKQPAYK